MSNNNIMRRIWVPTLNAGSVSIILWNLFPVGGVIFLGWKPESVFLFYALETIVIGLFNVLRLLTVYLYGLPPKPDETGVTGLAIIPFFLVHYFFFVFIQLGIFFAVGGSGFMNPLKVLNSVNGLLGHADAMYALGGCVLNHSFLFINNFIAQQQYRQRTMAEQMFEPYGRIFVQQFVVILGAFVFALTGSGWPVMVVFVIIKTYTDLLFGGFSFMDWARKNAARLEQAEKSNLDKA